MPNYARLHQSSHKSRIIEGLKRLREQLDSDIPDRSMDKTFRLATWNIREFDSPAYGERVDDAYYYIAEIMSRFDLIAVQEVRRSLDALDLLLKHLGWQWRYLVTDTTEGQGNDERLAFIYDTRKVRFTGLAGELVLADVKDADGKPVDVEQLVRTPYTAGFQAGWVKFQLATVHILYGSSDANLPARVAEIEGLARFLAQRSTEDGSVFDNLVLLGDFNIFAPGDKTMTALTDAGWRIPKAIQELPDGSNASKNKRYDQIAVLPRAHQFEAAGTAGIFDFYESVFRLEDRDLYAEDIGEALLVNSKGEPRDDAGKTSYFKTYWRTYQMSDHLPMWMDIRIDYVNEYLDGLAPAPAPVSVQNIM